MNHIDTEYDGAIPVATGDINGDDRIDIVACAYNLNAVTWWENTGFTSVEESETAGDLTSFITVPNPSNGFFSMEFSVNEQCIVSACIFDVSGRLALSIMEDACSGVHRIPVSQLATGIYLVHLRRGDTVLSSRISVIR